MPPKDLKIAHKRTTTWDDSREENTEMKTAHFQLVLRGVGMIGSTEYVALSVPCKRTGHYKVDLVFSPFFIINFTWLNQLNSADNKIIENYHFIIQQFLII
jgi:hypothetical protein